MIEQVKKAMQDECKALTSDPDKFIGNFVLLNRYQEDLTYAFPLLMLDMADGDDSHTFLGGATSENWEWRLLIYTYSPNSYVDDDSGFSEDLAKPIQIVRRHFTQRLWLTQGMRDLEANYEFRLTYGGTRPAPKLKHNDGLASGYSIAFSSVSLDDATDSVEESADPLEGVDQIDYPPIN